MAATIRHFSINANDLARARKFYGNVFGWTFEAWGPPGFYMIGMAPEATGPAVFGSLQGRREIAPGLPMYGLECTFGVEDAKKTAALVVENGGEILMGPVVITGVGELIWFKDTEGNVLGAMRYDERAE